MALFAIWYIHDYMGPKNNETITTFQKLQNHALRKITFKKCHNFISCIYKECKILKFPDILNLQNCLFMYQIQHRPKLSASFSTLYAQSFRYSFNKNKYVWEKLLKTFALKIGTIWKGIFLILKDKKLS